MKKTIPMLSNSDSANQQVRSGDLTLTTKRVQGLVPAEGLGVSPNHPISSPKSGGPRGLK